MCALADEGRDRCFDVRILKRLATSELLDVLSNLFLLNVEDVIDRYDSKENSIRIHYGQRWTVVLSKEINRHLLIAVSVKRLKGIVHERGDLFFRRRKEHLLNIDLINKLTGAINDVQGVKRVARLSIYANMIENFTHLPIRVNRQIVGGHESPDTSFRIPQKRERDFAFLFRKQR